MCQGPEMEAHLGSSRNGKKWGWAMESEKVAKVRALGRTLAIILKEKQLEGIK